MIKIVGIASCPAGLAHTPMASKALEKAGKDRGIFVKIEQQGIMGQVNKITQEEAQSADLVLIVSNQHLEGLDRFKGKRMIKVDIGQAVKNAGVIIDKCIEKIEN